VSRRKPHPDSFVTFVRDHVVTNPATVLQVPEGDGFRVIAEIAESHVVYVRGQVVAMGTVNAARAFARAMNGAAVVGKVTS